MSSPPLMLCATAMCALSQQCHRGGNLLASPADKDVMRCGSLTRPLHRQFADCLLIARGRLVAAGEMRCSTSHPESCADYSTMLHVFVVDSTITFTVQYLLYVSPLFRLE